jgi:hypothetical protein
VPSPLEPGLGTAQPKPNVRKTLDTTTVKAPHSDMRARSQRPTNPRMGLQRRRMGRLTTGQAN